MKPQEKRSKKYVDRAVQGAVVRRFLLHVGSFMVVGSLVIFAIQFLSNPLQGAGPLWKGFWQNTGPFALVLAAMLPIFVWDTIKLTNRVVGPMCRVRSTLRRINQGEQGVAPIRFRKGDFWHELAADLNTLIERLERAEQERKPAGQAPEVNPFPGQTDPRWEPEEMLI